MSITLRIMATFAIFCLVTTSLFSLYAIAFAYTVEDGFLEAALSEEAARQQKFYALKQRWDQPKESGMQVFENVSETPEELRMLLEADPARREFSGNQGRHYHVLRLAPSQAWLVYEVKQKLVFRYMRETVMEILIYSALSLLLLSLLLGWWLARTSIVPLRQLSQSVAALEPTQFSASFIKSMPGAARADELGVLARGIDQLVQRTQHFVTREQAFTRDASHELRTPLSVIRLAAERLADTATLSVNEQMQLSAIQTAANTLEQLLITLLTLAREEKSRESGTADKSRESGTAEKSRESGTADKSRESGTANTSRDSMNTEASTKLPGAPTRICEVLEAVILDQAKQLDAKMLQVDLDVSHFAETSLSAPVLRILLANLVSNAVVHSALNSKIAIALHACTFSVTNLALPGTLPSPSMQAFDKHAGSEGFGLGLSIVRRLSDWFGLEFALERTSLAEAERQTSLAEAERQTSLAEGFAIVPMQKVSARLLLPLLD